MRIRVKILIAVLPLLIAMAQPASALGLNYRCEFGIQGGCGYYTGDANEHIFVNAREAYGAFFRYMFDQRWAISVQGMTQRITGWKPDGTGFAAKNNGMWQNQLINLDAAAEFNFFRFGPVQYDSRIKPITPYLMTGLGVCMHSNAKKMAAYMPFAIGVKWQFAPRCNLKLAWQHNVYFSDGIEGVKEYNNRYDLNGSNVTNCDVTGMLCLGLSFEFGKVKAVCKNCDRY